MKRQIRKRFLFTAAVVSLLVSSVALAQEASPEDGYDAGTAPDPAGSETTNAPEFIPPRLLKEVEPEYPATAREEGLEADVVLEIDIDQSGAVEMVKVAVPASPPGYGFDEAAALAAEKFEFEPALEGGEPVPVRITYKIRFTLNLEAERQSVEENSLGDSELRAAAGNAAPKVNLLGLLRERGTRLPLIGVTVTVYQGEGEYAIGYESVTSEEGLFQFYDLEPGTWKVVAQPDGYFPLRTEEEIRLRERTEVKYFLERGDYNPYDVLVEGEQSRKEVNRTTLTVEEVEKVPGTFGDVLNVVKNFPGVARTSAVAGLVVRGSSPEDSEIFVNGVSVPIIYHFGGLRSVIPIGMLEKIDFYPGNFRSEFGRATGGIVDVGLKDLRPEKIGGYLDLNLFDVSLFLEAPIGDKAAVAVGARRSYIDSVLEFAVPDDASVSLSTAPRYYDYQLLFDYQPARGHKLKTFFFGSDDKLKVLFDNPAEISPQLMATNASTSTRFYRTLLEYSYTGEDGFSNDLQVSAGRNWVNFDFGEEISLGIDSYVAQIRNKVSYRFAEELTVSGGLDYLFNRSDIAIKLPVLAKEGEAPGRPDFDTIRETSASGQDFNSVGFFVEAETLFFDRLTIIPGFRFDFYSRVDELALSPRLIARYQINDKWTLKGGVGFFNQEPSFDETDEVFGNPNLKLETAMHYSVGVEFKPLPYLTLDLTGFYKDLDNLVSRTTETVERGGQIVPLNFNNGGEGRVYGLEFVARHDFTNNFTGWLTYTLSRSERKDFGSDEYRLFDYDQTHILTLVGTYNLPRNWSVGFRYRLVSGSPTTPRTGSVYDVDDGQYEPILGEVNSDRLPLFHQLDLRVDKRWVFDNWMLTAYLDIQNAYNQPNVTGYGYNYDSTEKNPRTGLPIIPIIGLKGEF